MQHSTNSEGQQERLRRHLRSTAYWMDELFAIPGTSWKLGIDALLGLFPVLGDIAGAALGLWLIREAKLGGVPQEVRRKMLKNLMTEMLLGFVPVVGDIFDVAFRANSRNRVLVEDWLAQQQGALAPDGASRKHKKKWILLGLLALAFVVGWLHTQGVGFF